MEKEYTIKEIMKLPILSKGSGTNSELIEAIGEKNFERLESLGIITHTKYKNWHRKYDTLYLNHWFLTKYGKEWVDMCKDRAIKDIIEDFFIANVLFGKTRWQKITETINMMCNTNDIQQQGITT